MAQGSSSNCGNDASIVMIAAAAAAAAAAMVEWPHGRASLTVRTYLQQEIRKLVNITTTTITTVDDSRYMS